MNRSPNPQISVVMPVYNALPFLDNSISSILSQTFGNFEFVILDDASTDGSLDRMHHWAARDKRIQVHESKERLGLAGSSNAVVTKSRCSIVARMDADDISHPDRLKRQWEIIEERSDIAVIGTLCDGIDASGRHVRPRDRWRLVRRSGHVPFPHGSAMFRRQTFDEVSGYENGSDGGEDQQLFSKMAKRGRVLTIPDVLYSYRYHSNNATLFNGDNHCQNGDSLSAYYMLGAMRLWAGESPMFLEPMLKRKIFRWDIKGSMILASALWGHLNPASLKLFLRASVKVRDQLASLIVKDGKPYEWRSE